jgi:hypothetical protein
MLTSFPLVILLVWPLEQKNNEKKEREVRRGCLKLSSSEQVEM